MNGTFQITETGEPHARRRRELLARYPSIRSLFGFDRRTALVTLGLVTAQLAIASLFALFVGRFGAGKWWLLLVASYLIGAPLTHWLAMAIHETSHRLALRTAWGNTALALIANVPLVLPFALSFNRYHLDHHRLLNVLGEDTDLPLPFEVRVIGNSTVRKFFWVLFHPLVYLVRGATFAKAPTRGELLNGLLIVATDLAICNVLGGWALVYLALSFFFALGLHPVAGHFIHEHYAFSEGQETFSYYGPLNWITFNVGYHNEHHDFMNIPGWQLPKLLRLVPEYGELASHRSWTGVLWHFIAAPTMGYGSRIVRTRATYDRGRAALAEAKPDRALSAPHSNERLVLQ